MIDSNLLGLLRPSTYMAGIRLLQEEGHVVLRCDHQRIPDARSADTQELCEAVRGVLKQKVIRLATFQRAVHEHAVQRALEQVFVHVAYTMCVRKKNQQNAHGRFVTRHCQPS